MLRNGVVHRISRLDSCVGLATCLGFGILLQFLSLTQYGFGQSATSVALPEIVPPTMTGDQQTVALPAIVDDVDVGGGGRYLALHFKTLRKIGVFDVNALQIAGYLPANEDDTKFALGATKAILVSGDQGLVTRYDLGTLERELTQTVDLGGAATHALLGSASAGPAIISVSDASGQSAFHTFTVTAAEIEEKLALERQKAEEQRKLAAERAQKEATEARQLAMERAQKEAADRIAKAAADRAAKSAAAQAFTPTMRTWTDATGTFKVTAKFVEIENRSTVVLEIASGEKRKVPLSRLSNEDIYEAVRSDLQRLGAADSPGTAGGTWFDP
jgi:hypothetical protein